MSLLKRLFSFGKKTLQSEGLAAYDAGIVAYDRKEYITAYECFSKLANEGHAISQLYVGVMYKKGQGVTKDYKKSFSWMNKAAKQGLLQAQYNLAVMYENGDGTQQSQAEAVHWYRKSAEQGQVYAQYSLARMLGQGIGIKKNTREAAKYLRLAAEQGHDSAQYNLALHYSDGSGVKENHAEAARWYKKAAEQEHIYAQFNLGVCYRDGRGVEQDNQEAVRWFRKAADKNLKEAQYSLGAFYDTGKGVELNHNEAANFYRKAAVQGHSTAQLYLGAMYKKGEGVPLDFKTAYAWFTVASANGCDDAAEQLDSLAYNMPTSQLELAKSLGREYLRKYQIASDKVKTSVGAESEFNNKIATPQKAVDAMRSIGLTKTESTEKESDLNNIEHTFIVGLDLLERNNFEAAYRLWLQLASEGCPVSQYAIGWLYESGKLGNKDYKEAVIWYRRASVQGYPKARYALHSIYQNIPVEKYIDVTGKPSDWISFDKMNRIFETKRWVSEIGRSFTQSELGFEYKNRNKYLLEIENIDKQIVKKHNKLTKLLNAAREDNNFSREDEDGYDVGCGHYDYSFEYDLYLICLENECYAEAYVRLSIYIEKDDPGDWEEWEEHDKLIQSRDELALDLGPGVLEKCKKRVIEYLGSSSDELKDEEVEDLDVDVEVEHAIDQDNDNHRFTHCEDSDNGYDGLESHWHEYHKHD